MTAEPRDAPTVDELRPQLVCSVADEKLGQLGYVVVDRTPPLTPAGGGIRLAPGLSVAEIAQNARTMTLKWSFLNLGYGGAKAGITAAPELLTTQRSAVMEAFGRGLRPLIERRVYFTGADLGTTLPDVNAVRRGFGAGPSDDPYADGGRATATTVVEAVKQTAAMSGLAVDSASVAIEGLGKVGVEIAALLSRLGARVVAVSSSVGGLYEPDGLDVAALVAARRERGDGFVDSPLTGRRIDPGELLALPVDVLIPCARCWTINSANADDVQARMIVPAANAPFTGAAEDVLRVRGVVVMPDFVANCGGILYGQMANWGFSFSDFEHAVQTALARRIRLLLERAHESGTQPAELARRIAWRNFAQLTRRSVTPRSRLDALREKGLGAIPAKLTSELYVKGRLRNERTKRSAMTRFLDATLASDLQA